MTSADVAAPGAHVVVLGLGLFGGGLGAARWALARGADVTVTDLRSRETLASTLAELEPYALAAPGRMRLVLGRHSDADFESADLVIVNPGVPPRARPLEVARASGRATLTTATALLLEICRARVVAITGTQGKSSTTAFLTSILDSARAQNARVFTGGNIGGSLLERASAIEPTDTVVLELSSYQLQHLPSFTPRAIDVAVVTCVGVDHLERHGTVEAYRAAKLRLFDFVRPGGVAILGAGLSPNDLLRPDQSDLRFIAREAQPPTERVDRLVIDNDIRREADGASIGLGDPCELRVLGAFQVENTALALAAAHALGTSPAACRASVASLRGLPHRLESLGRFEAADGRTFDLIDNGISTTPDSTMSAMDACAARFGTSRVLVVGGQLKRGQALNALAQNAAHHGWRVVPFGRDAEAIACSLDAETCIERPTDGWPALAEGAAPLAVALVSAGGGVLFSPACASFDAYPNFEHRALAFRESIERIARCLPPCTETRTAIEPED